MADDSDLQDVPLETPEDEGKPPYGAQQQPPMPDSKTSTVGTSLVTNGGVEPDAHHTAASFPESREPKSSVSLSPPESVLSKPTATVESKIVARSIADRVMEHSPADGLKQLAYLEILMADSKESVTDRDAVDTVLNVVGVVLNEKIKGGNLF